MGGVTGKCPYCSKTVANLVIHRVQAKVYLKPPKFDAAIYVCPNCDTVLGCEVDPITLRDDIIKGVVAELKKQGLKNK
jgi:hypothetical protein